MVTTTTITESEHPAGLLDRLRNAIQEQPTEFKWLGGIVAVFL
ncbi:MAG: hypothetical protein H6R23_2875, partial [Proteobacteria bacterium]|nr:hypothetical protein [Pseudomonadota bacterium]